MVGLLLLLAMIFLLLVGLPALLSSNKDSSSGTFNGVPPCPPHKWEFHHIKNQYNEMVWVSICKKCKRRPGTF